MAAQIETLLPASGAGFVTFARGVNGANQYGQAATIEAIWRVGREWEANHPLLDFSVGHISKKGGGPLAPHKSHRTGLDIDVRPLRKDGANMSVTIYSQQYNQAMTLELIELFRAFAPVELILFNDSVAVKAGLTRAYPNHDNHLHIRLSEQVGKPVLKLGDNGQAVRILQAALAIPVDGQFGFGTEKAVKKLQETHGLTADGIVGPDTWRVLG